MISRLLMTCGRRSIEKKSYFLRFDTLVLSSLCILIIFVLTPVCFSTRSTPTSDKLGVLSLLDQIADSLPAGPWKPIMVERGVRSAFSGAHGIRKEGGASLQTADVSVLSFRARVDGGKRIMVVMTCDARWVVNWRGRVYRIRSRCD